MEIRIISESDLIGRRAEREDKRRAWWLEMIAEGSALARETPAETIAQLLDQNQIKRVLVTRDGKLIGIVSRADLVRMVARSASPEPEATAEEDRRRQELRGQFPRRDPLN